MSGLVLKNLFILPLSCLFIGCGGGSSNKQPIPAEPAKLSYEVSVISSTGGNLTPKSQLIHAGNTATFNVAADTGYEIESISGCSGQLSGNIYTTGSITSTCEVSAKFRLKSYLVTATASAGGTVSPNSQVVQHGRTAVINIAPAEGHDIDKVEGCDGQLSGNIYTTGSITSTCEVSAKFNIKIHTVSVNLPDTALIITPMTQRVEHGGRLTFHTSQNTGVGQYKISGCGGYLKDSIYTIDSVKSDCEIGAEFTDGILGLDLYPKHEDSSIVVSLDLSQIDFTNTSLGYVIYKEDGDIYYSSENAVRHAVSYVKNPISKDSFKKVVANLKPGTEYEVCMTGTNDYKSTGFFGCKKIKTASKRDEKALVIVNYDVEESAVALIEKWMAVVQRDSQHIKAELYRTLPGASASEIQQHLKDSYNSSNLKHVVFIGYNIPALTDNDSGIQYLGMYSSLSNLGKGRWVNDHEIGAGEVAVAVVKPKNTTVSQYFKRLNEHYEGEKIYPQKVLLADAMIDAEKTFSKKDFENFNFEIDTVDGIKSYSNVSDAIRWQNYYARNLLENKYEILFIGAHGSQEMHYPCADGCIDEEFIEQAEPKAKIVIGVSCNIGYVLASRSPMISYIFGKNSGSLSALGAEVTYVDVNGSSGRRIMNQLKIQKKSIGDVSRLFGFIVIGDPFLTSI